MIFQPIGLPVQQNIIDPPPGPDDMFWVKNKWQSPATAHQKSGSGLQDRGGVNSVLGKTRSFAVRISHRFAFKTSGKWFETLQNISKDKVKEAWSCECVHFGDIHAESGPEQN